MLKTYNKILFFPVVILVLFSLVFTGCGKIETEAVKIGAILPLTGPIAWAGVNVRTGASMAMEEINAQGGIEGKKLLISFEDSKGLPKESVTLVNKFINLDKTDILMVLGTAAVNAVLPIVDNNNKLLFGFTIHPNITKKSKNLFRVYISGDQEWTLLGKYINDTGIKRIGVLHINAEYGIDSLKLLKDTIGKNSEIVYAEPYEIGQSDFRAILIKIKNKKVDAIVLMGYGNEYLPMLKQMKELKIDAKVLGNIDFVFDFVRKDPVTDGAVFVAPAFSFGEFTPKGKIFAEKIKAEFNREPSWDEAYGYDTVMLIAEAIKNAKSTETEKVRAAILQMGKFQGASGNLEITLDGDTRTPMAITMLKEGKIVKYK